MKFKYEKHNGTLRPVIPIILKNKDLKIGYHVLVDSGADLCLFDAEVGKSISIDIEKGKKREVFGVGGKASIYFLCLVEIEVGGWAYAIEAGFMPEVATIGILDPRGTRQNELTNRWQVPVISGSFDTPSIYEQKGMSGIYKEEVEVYARPYDFGEDFQETVRAGRALAKDVAGRIIRDAFKD